MSTPKASFQDSWDEPPVLGQATVKVYEMVPGRTQLVMTWPEDAEAETPETVGKRTDFVRFIQSELNTFLA